MPILMLTARGGPDTPYLVVVGNSLEPTDEELESLRDVLAYVIPVALVLAGAGGWFLARQSLAPVSTMAERARHIGADDLSARLPVANPRDELGRLAATFNDLLNRLEASLTQQRQFMADASHELRTPVATSRTAAVCVSALEVLRRRTDGASRSCPSTASAASCSSIDHGPHRKSGAGESQAQGRAVGPD